MDVLVDGFNLTKTDKKKQEKLEKINKINIHLQALFAAVENGQLEKAKNILQNNTFDINCTNDDGLTVLEVAIMSRHSSMIKTLQQAGATESTIGIDQRIKHFDKLVMLAECRKDELSSVMTTGNYPKETERQHAVWERRCKNLKKMKSGFDKLQVPGKAKYATVEVIDGTRVRVKFHDSFSQQSAVLTKYRVEWSSNEWATVEGSLELFDLRRESAVIEGLLQGCRHHFRVSAGNMKGYGQAVDTLPPSAVPSSWRDIDRRRPRVDGLLRELDDLFNQVRNSRPEHASEIKAIEPGQETPVVHRKAQKKKSLMHLFTHAPKFQKNLRRGSYFSCIIFCEDKVLLTTEDFPPVIEVDQNYLSQAKFHFHWLMKVATTWEDAKSLRQDMEQAGSASHVPYRIMFLQAAAHMQSALGIQDLGQFYHKPIKDTSGTYVFSTAKHIKSTKMISAMNVRWVHISKLRDRRPASTNSSPQPGECSPNAGDMLFNTIEEQISYCQDSQLTLKRGLYVGYLKLQSLVDQLQVVVPEKIPNMFPHVKVRENPHVSKEEWEWVRKLSKKALLTADNSIGGGELNLSTIPSPAQCTWQQQLTASIRKLLKELGIEDNIWNQHRLYTDEVLDLNCDVTVLLLLPAIESVCCAPGQRDTLLSRPGLIALPLHTFEMIHMGTYQGHLLSRYSRLSYILEMDILMAQHASREAFSEDEMTLAKERLGQLKQFQVHIDNVWKKFRWVMDSITFARDKSISGLPLTALSDNILISINTSSTKDLSGQESSSNNIKEFIFNVEDYNLNLPPNKNKYRKKDERRIPKSRTSENISGVEKALCPIPKSKTSECVFYSSSHTNNSYNAAPDYNSNSETHLNCKLTSHDNKMYKRDCATAKSESRLQCAEIFAMPPRKSSAPSFLGVDDEIARIKVTDDWGMESSSSSVSLDILTGANATGTKENNNIPPYAMQPMAGCSEPSLKRASDSKRTSSSMSHESEASFSSMTASLRSLSSNDAETDAISLQSRSSNRSELSDNQRFAEGEADMRKRLEEPAIIQVYAAYATGLAAGTSVKLHVTPRTTAREVIDLVVKQLNMAVVLKNLTNPIYGNEKLKDFCLVAVIGARERCFRDDFKPLQLQNPWKKGRLYVRLKVDVLAALEQSNSRNSSYL